MSWSVLPLELGERVLLGLGATELRSARLVCRQWNYITDQHAFNDELPKHTLCLQLTRNLYCNCQHSLFFDFRGFLPGHLADCRVSKELKIHLYSRYLQWCHIRLENFPPTEESELSRDALDFVCKTSSTKRSISDSDLSSLSLTQVIDLIGRRTEWVHFGGTLNFPPQLHWPTVLLNCPQLRRITFMEDPGLDVKAFRGFTRFRSGKWETPALEMGRVDGRSEGRRKRRYVELEALGTLSLLWSVFGALAGTGRWGAGEVRDWQQEREWEKETEKLFLRVRGLGQLRDEDPRTVAAAAFYVAAKTRLPDPPSQALVASYLTGPIDPNHFAPLVAVVESCGK